MEEGSKRSWDVGLGIVAPVLTIVGILVGVWQFNRGEENRTDLEYQLLARKDKIEFQRKLWLDRLSTYKSIAEQAGKIATTDKKDKRFIELVQNFDANYWGMMILVEDSDVEKAMIDFHVELLDYQKGQSDENKVKLRADELVKACRKSVAPALRHEILNPATSAPIRMRGSRADAALPSAAVSGIFYCRGFRLVCIGQRKRDSWISSNLRS